MYSKVDEIHKKGLILVTGGAGYIGSQTSKELLRQGYEVLILDNLINGNKRLIPDGCKFVEGFVGDESLLKSLFNSNKFSAVIHFAGFAYVRESILDPLKYYENNLSQAITLLKIMKDKNVKNLIFSSSCSIYGVPKNLPIKESEEKQPLSPYSNSKLFFEKILSDLSKLNLIKSVSLRYFNAAGADFDGELGEIHNPETHIIPLLFKSILEDKSFKIFGNDFPTKDGTAIRDYVHVSDLAKAHIKAMEYLFQGGDSTEINLGTGRGISILELISLVEKITKKKIKYQFEEKNLGDAPELVSDSSRAKKLLNWEPEYSLQEIIDSAWKWELKKSKFF